MAAAIWAFSVHELIVEKPVINLERAEPICRNKRRKSGKTAERETPRFTTLGNAKGRHGRTPNELPKKFRCKDRAE